jgi:hypothetical protein
MSELFDKFKRNLRLAQDSIREYRSQEWKGIVEDNGGCLCVGPQPGHKDCPCVERLSRLPQPTNLTGNEE